MSFAGQFAVTGLIFLAIDALWIGLIANKFYKKQIGTLLADKPRFVPAAIFYVLYIWAMIYFLLDPALQQDKWSWLLPHAAFFGLVMYATYDLTNASTLKKWPTILTVVDMVWGTILTTTVIAISYIIFR